MNDKLLVAVDYSGCAWEVVAEAAHLATRLDAEVIMLHVVHVPEGVGPDTVLHAGGDLEGVSALQALDADAKTELRALAAAFEDQGVEVRVEIRHGDAVEGILAAAREHEPTMLLTGTHGRTGVRRLFLGSVAEEVIRRAPCPVLTVRTLDEEAHPGLSRVQSTVATEADG